MERPSCKRSATETRNTNHEKDDQKIFQDDPSLQRMRRFYSRGETRTRLDYVLGYTQQQIPRSNVFIHCEQWVDIESSNDKNTGAIGWQDRDDDLEG